MNNIKGWRIFSGVKPFIPILYSVINARVKTGNKFKHFVVFKPFIHSSTSLWNREKKGCMIFFFPLFARILKFNKAQFNIWRGCPEVEIANSPRQYYEKIAIEINHSVLKECQTKLSNFLALSLLSKSRNRAPGFIYCFPTSFSRTNSTYYNFKTIDRPYDLLPPIKQHYSACME